MMLISLAKPMVSSFVGFRVNKLYFLRSLNIYKASLKSPTLYNLPHPKDSLGRACIEWKSLETLNNTNKLLWYEPEWGFPKGRRNLKETNRDCAIREFEEETGITRDEYNIIYQIEPLEELFSGSNNIRYKHIYYVAMAKDNINNNFTIDKTNFNQVSEISNIKWHNYKECMNIIRTYNIEKKNVLEKLHKILIN